MPNDDDENGRGKTRTWLHDEEDSEDEENDYIRVSADTGWRNQHRDENDTSVSEFTPAEIRTTVDDSETAERIIEALRGRENTRVRQELGPPPKETDSSQSG